MWFCGQEKVIEVKKRGASLMPVSSKEEEENGINKLILGSGSNFIGWTS